MRTTLIVLSILLATACTNPTRFEGEPRVPGGRSGCEQVCAAHGMVLAGMVSMGEGYTDGCICMVPGAPNDVNLAVAASAPAAAGVVIQMINDEEAAKRRSAQTQH